jgi:hypothetical protein
MPPHDFDVTDATRFRHGPPLLVHNVPEIVAGGRELWAREKQLSRERGHGRGRAACPAAGHPVAADRVEPDDKGSGAESL